MAIPLVEVEIPLNKPNNAVKVKQVSKPEPVAIEPIPEPTDKELNEDTTPYRSVYDIMRAWIKKRYELRYNIIKNVIEYAPLKGTQFEELTFEDMLIEMVDTGLTKATLEKLTQLLRSKFVPKYDPIEAYFKNLPEYKIGKDPDYIERFAKYIVTTEPDRFQVQFKKWLIRAVRCALGVRFNKQCLLFISKKQSVGKTTLMRHLAPGVLKDYYTEQIEFNKDGQIALASNILINFDELASLARQDQNQLKSWISQQTVKCRIPFEKRPVQQMRRANFIGTTNSTSFLTDETGSVRWLCFYLESIDFNYSKEVDMDKVWAQAYAMYRAGVKCDWTPEEEIANEQANKGYGSITVEMELIMKYYEISNKDDQDAQFVTATDIMIDLNSLTHGAVRISGVHQIGKAMVSVGHIQQSARQANGSSNKGYYVKKINRIVMS